MQTEKQNRILYFDYLRIIAIVAVVILHVAGQKWYSTDFRSYQWQVFNIIDSAVRWSVPIFVMISGALFLNPKRKVDTKILYSKNILRIVVTIILWSIAYIGAKGITGMTNIQIISRFIEGNYHMWYLYMILGLYMIVPILRKITESKKVTEYFLILGIIMTFIIPRVTAFLNIFNIPYVTEVIKSINAAINDMHFHITLGYVVYFILGYYLATFDISKLVRYVIYLLGPVSYSATAILTMWYSERLGKATSHFYSNMSINVLLMAICIFVFGKYVLSKIKIRGKVQKWVLHLSKCSFGIYLVHIMIMDKLSSELNFNTLSFQPILSVIIVTFVVFVLAYVVSAILNRIPILKDYIV